MSSTHVCVPSHILAFATRYALERKTTSADITVKAIISSWPSLARWEQQQLQKEISEDISSTGQPKAWQLLWRPVMDLVVHEEPTFSA